MTEMNLNVKQLKDETLVTLKRDLKSEMDIYEQSLQLNYQKTKVFLNYIPVIVSLIFVIFIIYYLVSGLH